MTDVLLPRVVLDRHRERIRSDPDLIVAFRPGARRDLVRLTEELEAIGYTVLRDTVPR